MESVGNPVAASVGKLRWDRRVEARASVALALATAGLVATALTAVAVAGSPTLVDPAGAALWRSAFVAAYVGVGLYLWWRRPDSRLGPLVAGAGFLYSVASLNASATALVYTLGMVVWVTVIVYLAYVYLCFPRGRLESRLERGFMFALALSTAVVWALILALSPSLPPGGSFGDCAARCPPNALQLGGGHTIGAALGATFNVLTTISLIALGMLIFNKARSSAWTSRRAMAPLTVVFLANIAEFVVFLFVGPAYPHTREAFRIAGGVVTLAVPFGILAGQVRGQRFAAMSLGELAVRASADPPTPATVQKIISDALGDPALKLAVWDADAAAYVDVAGTPLELAGNTRGHRVTHVTRDGWPVAALIHDPVVHTDSSVAEGLATTALMLLENWRLVEELRASRSRLVRAGELERQRVERDLHDGAQQRLMAIRIKVGLARDAAESAELKRQLHGVEREAEKALEELRELVHGIYPPVLHDFGLAAALRALGDRSSAPVHVSESGLGRYSEAIEAAIYFCAREAIQNAAKHAGAAARVTVTLRARGDEIELTVSDDGVGMPAEQASRGTGVIGMRDRIEAVGGRFALVSEAGRGTAIHAKVRAEVRAGRVMT